MTIYVLTDGDYSDYHIIGVFTDEIMAKKAELITGGSIEEWESDEIGKDNRFLFDVYFRLDHNQDTTDAYFSTENVSIDLNKIHYFESKNITYQCYSVSVLAEDKVHAIKIASDLVAQYKANH